MSDTVIRVENLSKKYILSHQQEGKKYKALRDVIADGAKSVGKKLLKPSKALVNPSREEFWALKDVSFEIKQGDRVGIIGRNGAGKSTLLKILSRIVEPTSGSIGIRGRVASLLEVGTGFHPELTGRENIYLNGAILGMGREEIKRKFDEIVAFAEVEKFLDTPVKRYSSGMYVRLAFAVAAHLEPEVLIVDEVLAVGDAAFQKKCLGKMGEVAQEGRTVLFVSHNMSAVKALCQKGIFMQKGQSVAQGDISDVIEVYINSATEQEYKFVPNSKGKVYFEKIRILEKSDLEQFEFGMGEDLIFEFKLRFNETLRNLDLGLNIKDAYGEIITHVCNMDTEFSVSGQQGESILFKVCIPEIKLSPGNYFLDTAIGDGNLLFDKHIDFAQITINDSPFIKRGGGFPRHVKTFSNSLWGKSIYSEKVNPFPK